jgi:hypothetical protein
MILDKVSVAVAKPAHTNQMGVLPLAKCVLLELPPMLLGLSRVQLALLENPKIILEWWSVCIAGWVHLPKFLVLRSVRSVLLVIFRIWRVLWLVHPVQLVLRNLWRVNLNAMSVHTADSLTGLQQLLVPTVMSASTLVAPQHCLSVLNALLVLSKMVRVQVFATYVQVVTLRVLLDQCPATSALLALFL